MISAALTSFLTGITEPIEFSFIFVAPILYIIHAILAGLAFPICILLGMRDGTSFSNLPYDAPEKPLDAPELLDFAQQYACQKGLTATLRG